MNIKVGDKVRIKSKEQLLNENWIEEDDYLVNDFTRMHSVDLKDCGQIVLIDIIDDSDSTFCANRYWFDKCIGGSCWFDICVIDEIVEDEGELK